MIRILLEAFSGLLLDVGVFLGVAMATYGMWLAWKPLGFIFGGVMCAALCFITDAGRVSR